MINQPAKWFYDLLLALGAILIGLNIFGVIYGPSMNFTQVGPGPIIPGRHIARLLPNDAINQFEQLKNEQKFSPDQKVRRLFEIVADSYIHGPSYRLKPYDNWLLWIIGFFDDSYIALSQDVDLLWRRGVGFCRQAAMIFTAKAKELGLNARIGLLTGHVVSEIEIPEVGWRVVDSDLDIFWDYSLTEFGTKVSREEIVNTIRAKGYAPEYAAEVAGYFLSKENNFYTNYPLSPKRVRIEQIASMLKWILPLVFILLAILRKKAKLF